MCMVDTKDNSMDSNVNSKQMQIYVLNCMVISTIDSSVKSTLWIS